MKIIVKSKINNNVLMTLENSREFNGKTIQELEAMKSESFDSEGQLLGYTWGGYLLSEDFYFEIEGM